MRKAMLFAPMICLCLALCGCGEKEETVVRDLQRQYAAFAAIEAEAELRCQYAEEVRDYSLACAYTPERSTVTVISPESVSGIAAVFDGETMALSYEDVLLDAGSFPSLSPLGAIPRFFAAIGEGYPLEYCMEGELLRITFEVVEENGEEILYAGWFDADNRPVRGEITVENAVVYELTVTTFTTEEQQDGAAAENMGGN